MSFLRKIKSFYVNVIQDKCQAVPIKCIADFKKTSVSYEQRIINENWTFDHKERDEITGGEVQLSNQFVYKFLNLERKLSSYKGLDFWDYIADYINNRPFTKVLSIGSGPCAAEIEIVKKLKHKNYHFDCIDLNENLINTATKNARDLGYNLNPIVGDINKLDAIGEYDMVIAIASLHHFVELEKLFYSINKLLKIDGEFVTYEPVCRSGMFLYRSQRILLGFIFALLPSRYRINHQDYPGEKRIDRFYKEYDRSGWTFECIRSGDLPKLLLKNFKVKHYGRGMTILRRLSDTLYGPNYDFNIKKDVYLTNILCWIDRFVRFFRIVRYEGLFFIGKKNDESLSENSFAGINKKIHPLDTMCEKDKEEEYFNVGSSAYEICNEILKGLQPNVIIDFPSGYGRVIRFFRHHYPSAKIFAVELDRGMLDFCEKEFDAIPIQGTHDLSFELPSNCSDLIFTGSLLTHLDEWQWDNFFDITTKSLKNDGILVFTTHGRRNAYLAHVNHPIYSNSVDTEKLFKKYIKNDFSFLPYSNKYPTFGLSLSRPSFVASKIEKRKDLKIIFMKEGAWGQDVWGVQKTTSTLP
jgi:SAM-dependent methyltransferase